MFDLFTPKSRKQHHVPIPKLTPRICTPSPTSTIALNPPPLKLYDCANFALNNINKLAKGQGYAVSKNGGGSQDASADGLPIVGGNISQAYSGRGALPFRQDFTEGSFGAFQL